jgi:hypothetical protein
MWHNRFPLAPGWERLNSFVSQKRPFSPGLKAETEQT